MFTKFSRLFSAVVLAISMLTTSCKQTTESNTLVILHTNDTHSQIVPDDNGLGGVVRRMAVIDSVRAAEENVMLIDAGDVVQGSLYFYLYGGVVEQELMNIMGVDMRILGNHEFDNGLDSLASVLKISNAEKLSVNYDFEGTSLEGEFKPYSIREVGGKKIGFIGVNLDPEGLIAPANYEGLKFYPIIESANAAAKKLKEEGVDAVVAITHIGYRPVKLTGDSILAVNSHDIDIIIGAHSHDVIDPKTEKGARRSRLTNLDGREVLVVQTGKAGRNLGKITINLDSIGLGGRPQYELIPIDSRYDSYANSQIESYLEKYTLGVDSLMCQWIGTTERAMKNSDPEMLNFFADFVLYRGKQLSRGVEMSIVNKGGLRTNIPADRFSKGHIINLVPFRNYIQVLDITGEHLLEVFEVMANTFGNGISSNVRASYRIVDGIPTLDSVTINGKPINPKKTYRIATIDYLAKGGDQMSALTTGVCVASSVGYVYDDLIEYFTEGAGKGKALKSNPEPRWSAVE